MDTCKGWSRSCLCGNRKGKRGPNVARRTQATLRTRICGREQHCPNLRGAGREGPGLCVARKGLRTARFSNAMDQDRTEMGQHTPGSTLPGLDAARRTPPVICLELNHAAEEWFTGRNLAAEA